MKDTFIFDYVNENESNLPGGGEEEKEAIPTTTTYIGYYADVDGNGSVDGIIYADLAIGGSGQWGNEEGAYEIPIKQDLNNYLDSVKYER